MAINNNTAFSVLVDVADSTGASEISSAARVNAIGGGAIDEQTILLENSIHCYTTSCRRAHVNWWASGAASSSSSSALFNTNQTALQLVAQWPATIGADRQALTALVHYQGNVKIDVLTPAAVVLDSHTFGAQASAAVVSAALAWSTNTDVLIRLYAQRITAPSAADGIVWGFRILEDQTTI